MTRRHETHCKGVRAMYRVRSSTAVPAMHALVTRGGAVPRAFQTFHTTGPELVFSELGASVPRNRGIAAQR
jgi:hypothetical protein